MDADERAIYYYLKSQRPVAVAVRDISRRVGGRRRFRNNPDWATPVVARMLERGVLTAREDGSCTLRPIPREYMRGKRWATEEIAAALKANGKKCANLFTPEDEEAYYDNL